MDFKCGTCRQFERHKERDHDACGAWGNPTTATRAACEFWMPGLNREQKQSRSENQQSVTKDGEQC